MKGYINQEANHNYSAISQHSFFRSQQFYSDPRKLKTSTHMYIFVVLELDPGLFCMLGRPANTHRPITSGPFFPSLVIKIQCSDSLIHGEIEQLYMWERSVLQGTGGAIKHRAITMPQ